MGKKFVVAVVGATGAVGREMLSVLEERNFPVERLVALASPRSAGQELPYGGQTIKAAELGKQSFDGVALALFSAGAGTSREYAPIAATAGAWVVDNSSTWRMDPTIPLVVPEVNADVLKIRPPLTIVANPNCSTIQMVVALKPIHDAVRIKRIVVSTYQAVSGAGRKAMEELSHQVAALFNGKEIERAKFPHQIAFNCIPHIDSFLDNGYTKEEMKMVEETRKILGEPNLPVTATTVRVPVFCSHSESVNVETVVKLSAAEARQILREAPGVIVADEPENNVYPLAIDATGKDAIYVGRIREDNSVANGLNLWVVSDNLRKGAALNAVQIAEILIRDYL